MNNTTTKQTVCLFLRTRGQHFEDFIAQGPHRSPDEQQQTDMSLI